MATTRRTVVLQLVGLATLVACEGPGKPGGGDTAGGDPDDTGADPTDTGGDTADTADTGKAVDACLEPTPLPDTCSPTTGDGEGPYFRLDAPERSALNVRGVAGTRLVIEGRLLTSLCEPVAGAKVHLWHAGPDGRYDTDSAEANLYGYVVTGDDGSFCFDTLRPPPYTDGMGGFLAAHLHFNVILADAKVLTTQLYFEGDPNLESWQDPARHLVPEPVEGGGERAVFDFVLRPTGVG